MFFNLAKRLNVEYMADRFSKIPGPLQEHLQGTILKKSTGLEKKFMSNTVPIKLHPYPTQHFEIHLKPYSQNIMILLYT